MELVDVLQLYIFYSSLCQYPLDDALQVAKLIPVSHAES